VSGHKHRFTQNFRGYETLNVNEACNSWTMSGFTYLSVGLEQQWNRSVGLELIKLGSVSWEIEKSLNNHCVSSSSFHGSLDHLSQLFWQASESTYSTRVERPHLRRRALQPNKSWWHIGQWERRSRWEGKLNAFLEWDDLAIYSFERNIQYRSRLEAEILSIQKKNITLLHVIKKHTHQQ
jgi:hypothetical protein